MKPSRTGASLCWAFAIRPAAAKGNASRTMTAIAAGGGHSKPVRDPASRNQTTAAAVSCVACTAAARVRSAAMP